MADGSAVIGISDELCGKEAAVFIISGKNTKISISEIIDFYRPKLADYKCPKVVYFVKDIPKGATGKLLKGEPALIYATKMTK